MKESISKDKNARTYTVSLDGSGDFPTIQAAIDAIPEPCTETFIIRIRQGVYVEKLHMEKPWIHLIGEGAEQTIVTYDDYALKTFPNGEPYHTFHSYSAFIGADDFTAEGLSFVNSAGPGKDVGQALAVYVDGDRAAFRKCRFIGHQDTIFTGPLPEQPIDRSFSVVPETEQKGGSSGSTTKIVISRAISILFLVRLQLYSRVVRFLRRNARLMTLLPLQRQFMAGSLQLLHRKMSGTAMCSWTVP